MLTVICFFSILQNIIDHKPKMHYLIAVDDAHNSLEEIVEVKALNKLCLLKWASYLFIFLNDLWLNQFPLPSIHQAIAYVLGPGEVQKVHYDSVHLTKELTVYVYRQDWPKHKICSTETRTWPFNIVLLFP